MFETRGGPNAACRLPKLINILRGDMSYVGFRAERPELHEQCVHDESLFAQRIRVSPWLTVVAQVYAPAGRQGALQPPVHADREPHLGHSADAHVRSEHCASPLGP
ncbi:MAG: hypothetical protein CMM55_00170 [Rhodospirillaceae bacterium]|nr:hypothetical protein [Rhodospirillaceae bacterium]